MNSSATASRVGIWLQATWHISVPTQWLDACILWIHQENPGVTLTQAQINKMVFEQWLLTDLRDLDHPVLPQNLGQAEKTEINGLYCIQIDSLVDVSQPAYSQLQKLTGKDCTNENVSAATQPSQKPWEMKPSRLLMLQLTDGVQHLQGMEYQHIPCLHTELHPGTKILLQGKIMCRLGVLLLKPDNVKVLGGEVDALQKEFFQAKLLCKLLGKPVDDIENAHAQNQQVANTNDGFDQLVGPSDEELLASLEADDDIMLNEMVLDSGYGSRSEHPSSLPESSADQNRHPNSLTQKAGSRDLLISTDHQEQVEFEDDDFPVEELEDVIFQEDVQDQFDEVSLQEIHNVDVKSSVNSSAHTMNKSSSASKPFGENGIGMSRAHTYYAVAQSSKRTPDNKANRTGTTLSNAQSPVENTTFNTEAKVQQVSGSVFPLPRSSNLDAKKRSQNILNNGRSSQPFTYLCELLSENHMAVRTVKVKAFIITLLSSLSSKTERWNIKAKISDGTSYLDVEISNEFLVDLIGYTVAETKVLKKDPIQRKNVTEGLQRCQQKLTDLCGIMVIEYNPLYSKAVLLSLEHITLETFSVLKLRVKGQNDN
ncbi:recQ-mediated genome instability protein 1 [Polypterus senegalus]|nr:recQ-mediated genome instability protein 1 [Polypterus senegalus]